MEMFAAPNACFLPWRLFASMSADIIDKLRAAVRDVPDFPKKASCFKDITPVLNDPVLFRASIDLFWSGAAAEGSIRLWGSMRAGFFLDRRLHMNLCRFCADPQTRQTSVPDGDAKYSLEYGEAEMEMHIDA